MKKLRSERLTLRRWEESDADFVFDMYSRWEVQRFIGGAAAPRVMESRSEAEDRINIWRAMDHPVHGSWAIEEQHSGRLIGTLLLKFIPASGLAIPLQPSSDTEIGWHLHPDAWANGYASEAASAVLEYAFDAGLGRVIADTEPANAASQKVCTRIDMTHEGLTSAYYNETCELFVSAKNRTGSSGRSCADNF
ncbi:GNAT family N-acetyltransferase [Arthrobacter sp. CG_A4]|uniref:GNAT family N-acetyltransferase n=1 Tax=Arthrobacter sp. CG_A4 TaxID=3071706 RepID=UPI002E086C74|nr:RimJ/RimL family protein N-acetyltransferase [Arthrobacter sp. CG_A4]